MTNKGFTSVSTLKQFDSSLSSRDVGVNSCVLRTDASSPFDVVKFGGDGMGCPVRRVQSSQPRWRACCCVGYYGDGALPLLVGCRQCWWAIFVILSRVVVAWSESWQSLCRLPTTIIAKVFTGSVGFCWEGIFEWLLRFLSSITTILWSVSSRKIS